MFNSLEEPLKRLEEAGEKKLQGIFGTKPKPETEQTETAKKKKTTSFKSTEEWKKELFGETAGQTNFFLQMLGFNGAGTNAASNVSKQSEEKEINYEEYIASQKALLNTQKAETDREIQTAFQQSQATYGANAESLGQAGLAGSGYAQYLNNQAEMQKIQTSNEAETTYQSNMDALNNQLYEYNETKSLQSAGLRADVISMIDNTGGVSAEYLNSLSKMGISESDFSAIKTYNQEAHYKAWKSAEEIDITQVNELRKSDLLTQEQYQDLQRIWNEGFDASAATFTDASGNQLSYAQAQEAKNNMNDSGWLNEENQAALEYSFVRTYASDEAKKYVGGKVNGNSKTVDVFSADFTETDFGNYGGTGNKSTKQGRLTDAIVAAVKSGEIQEGQLVQFNCGDVNIFTRYRGVYVYLGNGLFHECHSDGYANGSQINSQYSFFVPNGYTLTASGGNLTMN